MVQETLTFFVLFFCCWGKYTQGKPFSFRLGRGEVIKGWDVGVAGMRRGGSRTITCPPQAAYGKGGAGKSIPPNATLVFDVTVV